METREKNPFMTTADLVARMKEFTPAATANKFYAQLFQSLRIEVNREIEFLREMLLQGLQVLAGRAYGSDYLPFAEDRLVKNFFRTGNFEGVEEKDFYGNVSGPFTQVNRKVIVPLRMKYRGTAARSAKLRIAQKN
ncbi:MAG: 16S rRNA (cytosine(1402)-N(4))-methyltransferase [Bacteroidales bacterium]